MDWNQARIQADFRDAMVRLEAELKDILEQKIPHNPFFKLFYDEKRGALAAYRILEQEVVAESRQAFLQRVQELLEGTGIEQPADLNDPKRFWYGWTKTLQELVRKYTEV